MFVNVTAVDPSGPGYLTTWPAGTAQPNASTLNYGDRQTVANGAWVALGAAGRIAVFSEAASDVIVDVQGYVASPSPINVVSPARLVDTRTG